MRMLKVMFIGDVLLMLVGFILNLWQAYVTTVLWGWFIVPTFGAPKLAVWAAFGLHLVIDTFRSVPTIPEDDDSRTDRMVAIIIYAILVMPTILLFGWIAKHWL